MGYSDPNGNTSRNDSGGHSSKQATGASGGSHSVKEIESWLLAQLATQLGIAATDIDVNEPFDTYGLSSTDMVILSGDLELWLNVTLSPTIAYEYVTVAALAQHLAGVVAAVPVSAAAPAPAPTTEPIAIIGLGCRFPGAGNWRSFWRLLRDGVDAISEVPSTRRSAATFTDSSQLTTGQLPIQWGGFLEQVDQFDPLFFGIAPREAVRMDPQQRLLLEVAWEALEDAGQSPDQLAGTPTGVFIGIATHDYSQRQVSDTEGTDVYASTGSASSIAANRLSYLLDFRGPSVAIDTACSSSLVATHLACQSLRSGETNLALVGGVNMILSPDWTIPFAEAGLLAPDGRCKTFDASADGYVRSEGCGVVVLKRLSDAARDGDTILALVRGSAVNQDGRSNGLVAPNGFAQEAAITQALKHAGVSPEHISYVETHGTGTVLGDPIELNALKTALMRGRTNQPCSIGSVKTNIGHLEAAAGIAGLIKVVLALKHREIPPHLHFKKLNPHISLDGTPFTIPSRLQPWESGRNGRIAGVSSFGFGGTNAHIIVEEAPTDEPSGPSRPWHLLTLSAKTESGLETMTDDLVGALKAHPAYSLADIAYTHQTGRKVLGYRRMLVCRDHDDAIAALEGRDPKRVVTAGSRGRNRTMVFMFPGLGDHYVNMAQDLYQAEPVFRQQIDRCAEVLKPYLGLDLRAVLYPPTEPKSSTAPAQTGIDLRKMLARGGDKADAATEKLNQTSVAHPAIFVIEYALAQLWLSWGIQPQALIGYSIGEYVAACLAGVFSLEDALALVARRSQLIESLPGGAMLAVPLPEHELLPLLGSENNRHLSLAAINGPARCVVAGSSEAIAALERELAEQDLVCRRLQAGHAFHSSMMEPIRAAFIDLVKTVTLQAPQTPYISNVTGTWITAAEATDPAYWASHLCQTVRFGDGLDELAKEPGRTLLEVGPGQTLSSLAWQYAETANETGWTILPSLRHSYDHQPDLPFVLGTLGKVWLAGHEVDWHAFYADQRRRKLSLPTYPFERQRYWIEARSNSMNGKESVTVSQPRHTTQRTSTRHDTILPMVRTIVARLIQTEPSRMDIHAPFLEMGADSLVLVQAIRTLEKTFGVRLTIRQLFEELTTINDVAAYISQQVGPEWGAEEQAQTDGVAQAGQPSAETAAPPVAPAAPLPVAAPVVATPLAMPRIDSAAAGGMEQIVSQQLSVFAQITQVMSQQIAALGGQATAAIAAPGIAVPQAPAPVAAAPANAKVEVHSTRSDVNSVPAPAAGESSQPREAGATPAKPYVPYQPIKVDARSDPMSGLSPRQRRYLEGFIERFTQRTQGSKQLTQRYRPVLADNRASVGFRFSIKDMLYPIIGERSQGSRIWDVDGNEYIDLSMGFGVNLFGHGAPFIQQAIAEQLGQGLQLGPQSDMAGEAAELICKLTGMERVTFSNSGTEAVMMALRLARTATGRKKIALFAGSFHGAGDGTLVMADEVNGEMVTSAMAPGVMPGAAEHALSLEYGTPEALDIIRAHGHELAAVLVEPVQSRRPDLQPGEFLKRLRELTREFGIALIFDEIITGFRIHPGGAQAWFGVQADIATYGKVVGGGMPLGIIAGSATYMDGIDGGMWQYGDASYPRGTTTFFAGTFCKHPLTMAATLATLRHLQEHGPALQERLNQRTTALVDRLNRCFEDQQVPIHTVQFGSLFRFTFTTNMDLFFYHLIEKGLYVWEGRNMFLSTAHTDEDMDRVLAAIEASIADMRDGGFLPEPSPNGSTNGSHGNTPASEPEHGVKAAQDTSVAPVASRAVRDIALTEMQQEIWLQTQMGEAASIAYHNPVILRLRGELHHTALWQALQQVVDRHEALRTVFSAEGDLQRILPSLAVTLPLVDFSGASEQEAQVEEWLLANSRALFDLVHGPLIRAHLLKLAEHEHLLVLTTHQIVVDGVSIGLLIQEISACYSAACQNTPAQLPATMPFSEYVAWHHEYIQSEAIARAEAYWLEQYAGSLPILDLPTDHARRPIETYAAERQTMTIGGALYDDLKQLSMQQRCTLFMTMMAGFNVLLYRLTGQDDIVVGTPTAGRPDLDDQHLIGGCINLFSVRSRLAGDNGFTEYLTTVKRTLLDAYEHADYPFGTLIRKLNPPRDPCRWPLVSVFFNLDRPLEAPEFVGLAGDIVPHPISYANYELNVNIIQLPDTLELQFDYNRDLFDPETVSRWMNHFKTLLQGIVGNPQQRLADLPILTVSEQQFLSSWHDLGPIKAPAASVHQLFEWQAAQTPDAIAVTLPDIQTGQRERLSYRDLNQRANQVAHYLKQQGVGPEVLVGVCVERSLEMVVGLLGILKAGGAYVPLDPAYPMQRLALMLEDAQVPILLTQQRLVNGLPSHDARLVHLDADWTQIAQMPDTNPGDDVTPEQLAYIIFTSGSTGRSKGVMVRHGSLLNAYLAWEQAYRLRDGIRSHLQMASFSFDVFSGDLVRALCSGGQLVLCPRDLLLEPNRLYALIQREQIDCAEFVPAVLRGLMEYLAESNQRLESLRVLACGSDSWNVGEYKRFQALCGAETQLINSFGLTEATIDSTYFESSALDLHADRLVPIGRPFANTNVYVLSPAMQLMPPGITGEIYIGGAGVARGYFGHSDLTAERFIPDRWSVVPGARLYKTGDLARYLPDGNIEFLGRLDAQVKIRGFRIELGEIETVLTEHAAVRQAVVLVREDRPGNRRLVAYVVPASEHPTAALASAEESADSDICWTSPLIDELRTFLKSKLPDYMIPAAFGFLETFPLTPNRKIDRKALPAPEEDHTALDGTFVAPSTPTEELLVGIWAEVLGLERIGIHDNFFTLGGHSLLVTQVVSRIRTTFQIELSLRTLFDVPTVAGLAERINGIRQAGQPAQTTHITPVARDGQLVLSFSQQRLWFIDQFEGRSDIYNIGHAVGLSGSLDVAALEHSLNAMIQRHEVLRTTFATVKGQAFPLIADELVVQLTVSDLRDLPLEEREADVLARANAEVRLPFDIAQGPLLRTELLRLDEQEYVLLLTIHHIISDGWSLGVIIRELAAHYEAFTSNSTATLPSLPIQYVDYAHWQQQHLQGEALERLLSYWRNHLDGAPLILDLPTDYPRPAVQTFRGATQTLFIPHDLTMALRDLSQRNGATLFMTLLAAFQTLLHRYSGSSHLVVGTPIANRTLAEVEDLIGFFVNTLALHADLSGNPRFVDLLAQVQEATLGAYAHQDLPFERLVSELQPTRDLSRHPLFQVAFVLQNALMSSLQLSDLTLSLIDVDYGTAKFDLMLQLEEREQGLTGLFEYNTDLFEHATITRMIGHFQVLLESIAATPDRRIADLVILTPQERQQQVIDWNTTTTAYPREACIHQLFEEQAAQSPAAIALRFNTEQLTYEDLNRRANQLAHYLRTQGVGPDTLVAVYLDRSPTLVVALLAILKAGGAYLPLDRSYPASRFAFMLSDTRTPVILTDESMRKALPTHTARIICLDGDAEAIAQADDTNPANLTSANHLAYVIYTSGSTGTPKGVRVTHRSVVRLVKEMNYVTINADDVLLQIASVAFDAATFEIWGALLNGARLGIVTKDIMLSPEEFAAQLRSHNATTMFLTTALFNQLAQTVPGIFKHVRHVLVGGEAADPRRIRDVLAHEPPQRLLNVYGPTEATTFAAWHLIEHVPEHATTIPIGRPLSNDRLYVLDPWMQPVPVGVAGELYIGGDGLARDYLNQPGLTAEKFVPDPFSGVPGVRLYRTGDRVRYMLDGGIEFLGRKDHQVKIRGFRIEPGEIEVALGQHPDVRAAVVLVREDSRGSKRLVAYVVVNQSEQAADDELAADDSAASFGSNTLRSFLQERLPDYMIPAAFVMLDEMPLTPNGKVDRSALPMPEQPASEQDANFVAPRTLVEQTLRDIWAEALGLERVGIHDNFFMLGGDSILSIQIVARANQSGLRFHPKQLFKYQTIAELATVVDMAAPIQADQGLVTGPVLLTPIQQWFFDQQQETPDHFNQGVLLSVDPSVDPVLLEQAFHALLPHHDALRLRFTAADGSWHQQHSDDWDRTASFQRVQVGGLTEADLVAAIAATAAELQTSLDLAAGPLVRAACFEVGQHQPARLLVVIHHLVIDGVSWRILLDDLQTAYRQLYQAHPIQLPPKTTSFQYWAERLAEHAQSATLGAELEYWLAQPWSRATALPTDYPAHGAKISPNTVASAAQIVVALDAEATHTLLHEVPEAYHTQINDVLLTALAQTFSRWTGSQALLVDLEGHGRESLFADVDLSRTVGWFTSIYPVLLTLDTPEHPGEQLKSVKEQLRSIPNHGIGYGLLHYLRQDATAAQLRSLPHPEISFNYLGQIDRALDADALFVPANEPSGPDVSSQAKRVHALDITGQVIGGKLELSWVYSQAIHRPETVERLASSFMESLRALIDHCLSPNAGSYTPSDFPLAHADQDELDVAMNLFEF